jgi:molybdopterin-containing oxidoreductase family iron-sulfur binding subunit
MNCGPYKHEGEGAREPRLDLAQIRARLGDARGKQYWRSLEELGDTKSFRTSLHREFPTGASEWRDEISRRHFVTIMGASFALAGMAACTKQPVEKIVPYVKQPPEITPGKPLYFATAMPLCGYGMGVIATSHEGRPTKIEGNPDHPASLGATSIFMQAGVLDLYDPDRAQEILYAGDPSDWETFLSTINATMPAQAADQGARLRILTQTVTSQTLASQLQGLMKAYPSAKWSQWEPVTRDNVREGARLAFGQIVEPQYHFDKADVILALDSDFLFSHPGSLRYARDFADRRRVKEGGDATMNRLYAAEPTPSITGVMADHRLPIAAVEIEALAQVLAARLGIAGSANMPLGNSSAGALAANADWMRAAARDLQEHRGKCIVIAGESQPPAVHALVHQINQSLGAIGQTVTYTAPVEVSPVNQLQSLRELVAEMNSGSVELLIMIGGNPVFDSPADLDFGTALQKVKTCIRLGTDYNETSRFCHWHIAAAHYLESWSDARAYDGTASIVQPLLMPLYNGKTAHELIDAITRQPSRQSYDIVYEYWASQNLFSDFDKAWRQALSDGVLPNTASPASAVSANAAPESSPGLSPKAPEAARSLELVFRPDPTIWDGTFNNNAWLQELAKPLTKLTWDNAALISAKLAEREQLQDGDVVELQFRNRTVRAPVRIMPGQADNSVTVHLGYGRGVTGRVGKKAGFNAYALRTSGALWFGGGLEIRKTGETYPLSVTQKHHNTEGRDIIREGTLDEFNAEPSFIDKLAEPRPGGEDTLYKPGEFKYPGYKWGMSIDLNVCIGCNACTIACQAENNIPVVGKYQVSVGRDMQWIRVDSYFSGGVDDPRINHQPVPCMHCENAPCELVCPVGATVTDDEGLNVQVYNRCIGTRYCSNNCPYKVRRFNFLEFNAGMTDVQKMVKNPDVTVRSRGVMEKCTYCTQRIDAARITAEEEDRRIRDGEVVTACQAACPVNAIVFGDLNDRGSKVAKLKSQPLDYWMLGELNTRPRTSYLAKLRNQNPELKS